MLQIYAKQGGVALFQAHPKGTSFGAQYAGLGDYSRYPRSGVLIRM
ncbi:MAG: hypothetical protein AB2792_02125 [Candidatus Thiodiazotropha sp.]